MNTIDCVILWVDGSDREWVRLKNKCSENVNRQSEDDGIERYRDFGVLKYLFRGIEKFMPWIRNVFFVTCGQRPHWMNTEYHKLKFVNHKDFIPEQYLPTFNTNPIEMNLHRIQELSEQFVYFNDDMFVIKETKETDFFRNGLPCDSAVFNAIAMKKGDKEFRFLMPLNDMEIINKHFNKSECMKRNWRKFYNLKYGKDLLRTICLTPWVHFTGFYNYHLPYSLKKNTLKVLWDKEPEILDDTSSHKFRNSNDVNIWLALYWQYANGQFAPRSPKIGYKTAITDDSLANEAVYNHIKKQKSKIIVINDEIQKADVAAIAEIKKQLINAFEQILPIKSKFEK